MLNIDYIYIVIIQTYYLSMGIRKTVSVLCVLMRMQIAIYKRDFY